jgi:hypothetical protein
MKNIITSFLLVTLFSFLTPDLVLSSNDNQLITQIKVVENDSTFQYLYLYNDDCNLVLEAKLLQQDNNWVRKSLTEWMYAGNKCVTQQEMVWQDNKWNLTYSIDYQYTNNMLISEIHNSYSGTNATPIKKSELQYKGNLLDSKKEYIGQNGQWHLSIITDFSYLSDGKSDSVFISNYQSDALSAQVLSKFHYNNDGILDWLVQKQKIDQVWINSDLTNWYYIPGSNQILTQKNKKWNSENSVWENEQRIDYQYNDNNQIVSETYQYWKTMFWKNDIRYDYSYDGNKILVKKVLSEPIYDDWRGIVSINYSDFNLNKANTIKSQYEFWGGNTGELTTSFIPFFFNDNIAIKKAESLQIGYLIYDNTLLSNSEIKNINQIQAYPNPSNGIFYINSYNYEVKSWTVSDLNGRVLKKEDQNIHTGVIDISDFPKGIYLLKIATSDSQPIQKLLKQ